MSRRKKQQKPHPIARFLTAITLVLIAVFFAQSGLKIHHNQVLHTALERIGIPTAVTGVSQ